MRVLALFPVLLVRLVGQDLDAFSASRLILAGFGHGVQLPDLVLTGDRSRIGTPPPRLKYSPGRSFLLPSGTPGLSLPTPRQFCLDFLPGAGGETPTSCTEHGKATRLQRGRERARQLREGCR